MVRSITAPVKFLKWQDLYRHEKPFELFVDLPKESQDQRRTNIVLEEKDVLFQDVRGKHHDFDLDHHAFMFTLHRSSLTDYAIREEVEKIYLPEVENLIKSTVEGADKVTIFDWRLRNSEPFKIGATLNLNSPTERLAPVRHAHIDQSPAGVLARVKQLHPIECNTLLRGRVRIINVWRPLKTVDNWPLAVCDGSTVKPNDAVEVDHIRRSYHGLTLKLQHRTYHSWHYMSRQTVDEVLLFKIFDSSRTAKATSCPHVSFEVLDAAAGCPPRESIEVRALVFTLA